MYTCPKGQVPGSMEEKDIMTQFKSRDFFEDVILKIKTAG